MKIYIGCDHRGIEFKTKIINYLLNNNIDIEDIGLPNNSQDNYPDFAFKLGELINNTKDSLGILICGSGIGMSIAANKVKGIRCARVTSVDDAFSCKNHNGANVIALGVDTTKELKDVYEIIDTYIHTKYPNEERHLNRIKSIIDYEENHGS